MAAAVVDLSRRLNDRDLLAPDPTTTRTAAPLQIEAAPTDAAPPTTLTTTDAGATGADAEPPPCDRVGPDRRFGTGSGPVAWIQRSRTPRGTRAASIRTREGRGVREFGACCT